VVRKWVGRVVRIITPVISDFHLGLGLCKPQLGKASLAAQCTPVLGLGNLSLLQQLAKEQNTKRRKRSQDDNGSSIDGAILEILCQVPCCLLFTLPTNRM
jgi:hypothetical protein